MYDQAGAPVISCMAPMLLDVCAGMLYLHSRNIVHGGRHGRPGQILGEEGQARIQIQGVRPGSRSWGADLDPATCDTSGSGHF